VTNRLSNGPRRGKLDTAGLSHTFPPVKVETVTDNGGVCAAGVTVPCISNFDSCFDEC
jgi:hypothetical protein